MSFRVQRYKVYYTSMASLPQNLWTVHEVEGSVTSTTISDLRPNQTYRIAVSASNLVGESRISDTVEVLTRQGGACASLNSTHPTPSSMLKLLLRLQFSTSSGFCTALLTDQQLRHNSQWSQWCYLWRN